MTAPQAAGVIHTDFERGFIRAETVGCATIRFYRTCVILPTDSCGPDCTRLIDITTGIIVRYISTYKYESWCSTRIGRHQQYRNVGSVAPYVILRNRAVVQV